MERLIIFLFFVLQFFFLDKVIAQEKFEIIGIVPIEYEAADIKISAPDNTSFPEIKRQGKKRKIYFVGTYYSKI